VLDAEMLECGAHAFSEHSDAGKKFDGM